MMREELSLEPLQWMALAQRVATVLSSGFNMVYFATYSNGRSRRRFAARVLVTVNLALLVESAYLGLLPLAKQGVQAALLTPGALALSGTLPLLASLLITAAIVRQQLRR